MAEEGMQANANENAMAVPHHAIGTSKYDVAYNKELGKKLRKLDELRPILAEESIDCPGVIVVGPQGAGKSSVLEGITGIRFPQAENICTRSPIVVQLQVDPNIQTDIITVADNPSFRNGKRCESMEILHAELQKHADEIKRRGTAVEDTPIYIRYVRQNGPVLTLMDLPGISWDQNPPGIHEQTVKIIENYAVNENMIMLVVFSAIENFGNEALTLAERFDSEGKRIIGVATKVDLVAQNSREFLRRMRMEGDDTPKIKHGFFAIRNRLEGEENESIDSIERRVFSNHALLNQLEPSRKGFGALTNKVVEIQSNLVDDFLSGATRSLREKHQTAVEDLAKLGDNPEKPADQLLIIRKILARAQKEMGRLIRTEKVYIQDQYKHRNIANYSFKMFTTYKKEINSVAGKVLQPDYENILEKTVDVSIGYKLPAHMVDHPIIHGCVNNLLFNGLVEKETSKLINDVKFCMSNVYGDILLTSEEQTRFPNLRPALIGKLEDVLLADAVRNAKNVTDALIAAEVSNPFTLTDDFMKIVTLARRVVNIWKSEHQREELRALGDRRNFDDTDSDTDTDNDNMEPPQPNGALVDVPPEVASNLLELKAYGISNEFMLRWMRCEEDNGVHDLQLVIYVYVRIIALRICDVIPMVVKNLLMFEVYEHFYEKVLEEFDKERKLKSHMKESDVVQETRNMLKEREILLRNAIKTLDSIPTAQKM